MKTVSTRKVAPVLIGLLVAATTVAVFLRGSMFTANLTPTVSPGTASGFTLEDIWSKIANNTYTAASGHASMAPSDTPSSPTLRHTVDQIFNAIPTITASKVLSGTTLFGIRGTANNPRGATGGRTLADENHILSDSFAFKTDGSILNGTYAAPSAAHYPSGQSYTDNHDGTITDASTGLVWQMCSQGQTWADGDPHGTCTGDVSYLSQSDGETSCEGITGGGWRLPSLKELETIVDTTTSIPAIDSNFFPSTPSDGFWSSSPYVNGPGGIWLVYFNDGLTSNDYPGNPNDVRCVRPAI